MLTLDHEPACRWRWLQRPIGAAATDRAADGHDGRALVPLRFGTRPIGLLAAAGRPSKPGTLDALGGVAAIAIERAQFLEERKAAELRGRARS